MIKKVDAELNKVVASQPVHSADHAQAKAAAEAFLGVLPDPNAKQEFDVAVSGSVGWSGVLGEDQVLTSAGVNVSATLVAKEKV